MAELDCEYCDGSGWVCEAHPELPCGSCSDSPRGCKCGGAGMPCRLCNIENDDGTPDLPTGFKVSA
jgi:hypothetical protein